MAESPRIFAVVYVCASAVRVFPQTWESVVDLDDLSMRLNHLTTPMHSCEKDESYEYSGCNIIRSTAVAPCYPALRNIYDYIAAENKANCLSLLAVDWSHPWRGFLFPWNARLRHPLYLDPIVSSIFAHVFKTTEQNTHLRARKVKSIVVNHGQSASHDSL